MLWCLFSLSGCVGLCDDEQPRDEVLWRADAYGFIELLLGKRLPLLPSEKEIKQTVVWL
jgi:hypothetical protein